jgi:hypothetical protein
MPLAAPTFVEHGRVAESRAAAPAMLMQHVGAQGFEGNGGIGKRHFTQCSIQSRRVRIENFAGPEYVKSSCDAGILTCAAAKRLTTYDTWPRMVSTGLTGRDVVAQRRS